MSIKTTIRNQERKRLITGAQKFSHKLKYAPTKRPSYSGNKKLWMPDDKPSALIAYLRVNCCRHLLNKMDDTSPEGVVLATIMMDAKATLQELGLCL